MPDRHPSPPPSATPDWSNAFARLPLETPPGDGWARIAARLSEAGAVAEVPAAGPAAAPVAPTTPATNLIAPRRRARTPRRWAIAAMLAAALPLAWWLSQQGAAPSADGAPGNRQIATGPAQARSGQIGSGQADSGRTEPVPTGLAHGDPEQAAPKQVDPASLAQPTISSRDRPEARALADAPSHSVQSPRRDRKPGPAPASAAGRDPIRLATRSPETTTPALAEAGADYDAIVRDIGRLQAQSAQLEALIAASRDDRVASASAAVMSSELDQRLGLIDATLVSAALPAPQRLSLWQQRVGTLRALAGVESTQRWFAAQGERYDDALVRVD